MTKARPIVRNGASLYGVAGQLRAVAALLANRDDLFRFLRMCSVSLLVNGFGYIAYLLCIYNGIDPKLSASIAFVLGTIIGFTLNRSFTFRDPSSFRRTLPKYLTAYLVAYVSNISGLYLLIDVLHYRADVAQAILIVVISAALYLAQRFWIFVDAVPPTPAISNQ